MASAKRNTVFESRDLTTANPMYGEGSISGYDERPTGNNNYSTPMPQDSSMNSSDGAGKLLITVYYYRRNSQ